jgi:hypothetical protein
MVTTADPLRRVLTFQPFKHQAFLLRDFPERQGFMPWGTKAGKTSSMVMRVSAYLWGTREQKFRWIAPTYGLSSIGEKRVMKSLPARYVKHWKGDRVIEGPQGSTLQFMSGDNPDLLAGEDVHGAVIDEAPRCKEDVYDQVLSTTLAANGWLAAIGTPKGRNWFYRHVRQAQQGFDDGNGLVVNTKVGTWYKHFPSYVNPGILRSNLDNYGEVTTELVYKQLILAEFVDDSAGVFPSLDPCTRVWERRESADPDDIYVMGVDVGAKNDWAVITIWSTERMKLEYWERFVDTILITQRVTELSAMWNSPTIYIDRGGMGHSITMDLYRNGLDVGSGTDGEPGVHFTGRNKPSMVHNWNLAIERQEPMLPPRDEWPELHDEHNDYEYTITKVGNWTFSAPEGKHDDIVASCILGWYGLTKERFTGSVWVI